MPTMRAATATNSTPKTPDARGEHRALQRRHVPGEDARARGPATSTTVATPPKHEAGRQVAVRALRRPRRRCRASRLQAARDGEERPGHRRQPAQHGEDARRRPPRPRRCSGRSATRCRRRSSARRASRSPGTERRRQAAAEPGDERRQRHARRSARPRRRRPTGGSRGCSRRRAAPARSRAPAPPSAAPAARRAARRGTGTASEISSFTAAPTAMPRKIQALPPAPPLVARSTSAHAVPSGYGSSSCACTISSRRSGIIADRPSRPPRKASATTCRYGRRRAPQEQRGDREDRAGGERGRGRGHRLRQVEPRGSCRASAAAGRRPPSSRPPGSRPRPSCPTRRPR